MATTDQEVMKIYGEYHAKGVTQFKAGQYREALDSFDQAIECIGNHARKQAFKQLKEEGNTNVTGSLFNKLLIPLAKKFEEEISKTIDVRTTLSCRSACYLKLDEPMLAQIDAKFALLNFPVQQKLFERLIDSTIAMDDVELGFRFIGEATKCCGLFPELLPRGDQLQMKKEEIERKLKSIPHWGFFEFSKKPIVQIPQYFEKVLMRWAKSTLPHLLGTKEADSELVDHDKVLSVMEQSLVLDKMVEIRTTKEFGRGLYATENIALGDFVLVEKPYLCCTCDVQNKCGFCLQALQPGKKVSCQNGCGCEWYCSQKCRNEAWKLYHEAMCGWKSAEEVSEFLHNNSERSASKYHLFALKYIGMMLRLCMTDENGKLVMSVDEKHLCMVQFLLLMHFVPDRKFTVCPDYIQEFLPNMLHGLLGKLPYQEMFKRACANAYGGGFTKSKTGFGDTVVLGCYSSFANHSCDFNTAFTYFWTRDRREGRPLIVLEAHKNIKKGEQILVPYVSADTKPERRSEHLAHYGFACSCKSCLKDGCHTLTQQLLKKTMKLGDF